MLHQGMTTQPVPQPEAPSSPTNTADDGENSKKRPHPSGGDGETEKLAARREANRVHAFKSRQRSKALLQELQRTVELLSGEKSELERENAVLRAQVDVLQQQNLALTQSQRMLLVRSGQPFAPNPAPALASPAAALGQALGTFGAAAQAFPVAFPGAPTPVAPPGTVVAPATAVAPTVVAPATAVPAPATAVAPTLIAPATAAPTAVVAVAPAGMPSMIAPVAVQPAAAPQPQVVHQVLPTQDTTPTIAQNAAMPQQLQQAQVADAPTAIVTEQPPAAAPVVENGVNVAQQPAHDPASVNLPAGTSDSSTPLHSSKKSYV